ncbi:unnamed protein product [Ilex paraguariensis]|uniref:Terpene synthase N-terminal domain-containing protein n=1 Tax=Ilex paraguariensis TaxID=185542 RepID=A0ABC8RWA0_9AQUA
MDKNGEFKELLSEDTLGMLSLYEASYLGVKGEDVLQSLELPRHLRMARLEARRYIEEYSRESDHNSTLLELAKLEYNQVQSLHQMELAEVSR